MVCGVFQPRDKESQVTLPVTANYASNLCVCVSEHCRFSRVWEVFIPALSQGRIQGNGMMSSLESASAVSHQDCKRKKCSFFFHYLLCSNIILILHVFLDKGREG